MPQQVIIQQVGDIVWTLDAEGVARKWRVTPEGGFEEVDVQ